MKVTLENPVTNPAAPAMRIPQGLVGFGDYTSFEVVFEEDQLPFRWMILKGGPAPLHFVVIEPGGIIPDYEPELFDEDAAYLGIADGKDALVLNIVTVRGPDATQATVNLVGPVVINRHTGLAKQVVIANHSRYNARHPLVTAG